MGTLKNMSVTDLIRAGIVTVTREDIDYLHELLSVYEEEDQTYAITNTEKLMRLNQREHEELVEATKTIVFFNARRTLSEAEKGWIRGMMFTLNQKGV